jgi:hypothetical protein
MKRYSRKGAALILVLVGVAVLMLLMVSFMLAVTNDTSSTSLFAAGSNARQVASLASDLVRSQLLAASGSSTQQTWTSQPGLLRTFDDTGAARQVFKLYSASRLVADASDFIEASGTNEDTPPATWNDPKTYAGIYVDLNQPALDTAGQIPNRCTRVPDRSRPKISQMEYPIIQ